MVLNLNPELNQPFALHELKAAIRQCKNGSSTRTIIILVREATLTWNWSNSINVSQMQIKSC